MTGYEEQWINDHADPDEKRPRFFNPDEPMIDWEEGDLPPYEDDDIIYDEDDERNDELRD